MKHSIYIYVLFFSFLAISACRKIPAGIETTITGKVQDPNTNKPIAGATIAVKEYKPGSILYGPTFNGIIDSVRTDNDGNYQISFTTTGRGTEYQLAFGTEKSYYSLSVPIKLNVGKDTAINFLAIKMHTLKARVIVINNYNPPLTVYSRLPRIRSNQVLTKSTDTTFFLNIVPNQFNDIYFGIVNIDTPSLYQVDPKLFWKRL